MGKAKVSKYVRKYKRIMKKYNPFVDDFLDVQIEKIIRALESEDYETKKQFVEGTCIILDIKGTTNAQFLLHKQLFEKIIVPVFAIEYKKNNAKFIKWIGQCDDLFSSRKNDLLKQIDDFDADSSFEFVEYFCGKSFMLDKNQETLDIIMKLEKLEVFLLVLDSSDYVHRPYKYFEYLKSVIDRMERCKEYCKISGNDKWDTLLADWELLVTNLYKYEEYVKNNDYLTFQDYLEKKGVDIDYGPY